jgi:hypothetical protein
MQESPKRLGVRKAGSAVWQRFHPRRQFWQSIAMRGNQHLVAALQSFFKVEKCSVILGFIGSSRDFLNCVDSYALKGRERPSG